MHKLPKLRSSLREAEEMYDMMIEAGESPNVDRMGFASTMIVEQVRTILESPSMQADDLAAVMRATLQELDRLDTLTTDEIDARVPRPVQAPNPDTNWESLMAGIIMQRANQN